jgi:hypothetical protein
MKEDLVIPYNGDIIISAEDKGISKELMVAIEELFGGDEEEVNTDPFDPKKKPEIEPEKMPDEDPGVAPEPSPGKEDGDDDDDDDEPPYLDPAIGDDPDEIEKKTTIF